MSSGGREMTSFSTTDPSWELAWKGNAAVEHPRYLRLCREPRLRLSDLPVSRASKTSWDVCFLGLEAESAVSAPPRLVVDIPHR